MRRTIIIAGLVILAAVGGLLAGIFLASGAGDKPAGVAGTASISGTAAEHTGKVMAVTTKSKRKILYYWDPMVGPSSISPKPGISSMGMKLIPVYAPASNAAVPGEVRVNPAMVQDMGIQTGKVTFGPLTRVVRTVGYLRVPDPQRYDITIRAGGWIGKLYATTNGTAICKGQKLFTLYSPRIVAAEGELIAAQQSLLAARKTGNSGLIKNMRELRRSVAMRLHYLGVSQSQIHQVQQSRQVVRYVRFDSPAGGVLTDITVRQKSRINAGITALRVENLSTLWLDTYVYENQLPWVHEGQRISAHIAAFPGEKFTGKIIFIDPFENVSNHTTTVRISLNNAAQRLRPGMYALAKIATQPIPHVLLAPRQAIINTGTGELAFVEVSHGHFDPVTVQTGLNGEHGLVQVLAGLLPGEKVVTSGQFMIDVESQLNQIKARFMPKVSTRKSETGVEKRKSRRDKPGGSQKMDASGDKSGGSPTTTRPTATMPAGMKM
ncbi:MAG: efflux RND transporter periplasmic adaptor subunit [Phycisphaerae bacterium]